MDAVDRLMDIANNAVERTFGKVVTYTGRDPHDNGTVKTWTVSGDFQEINDSENVGGTVEVITVTPQLDFRRSHLESVGLSPIEGSTVTFKVYGETRAYRVAAIMNTAPGSVILQLSELRATI